MAAAITKPVLVVGCGPAGLVTALVLQANDIPFRIIEKGPLPRVGSRGACIMPRSLEIYDSLSILEEVRQLGRETPRMKLYALPGGTDVVNIWDFIQRVPSSPSIPFPQSMLVGQDRAETVMISRLEANGCKVELGTELELIEQHEDFVTVYLKRRVIGGDEVEMVDVSFLVGGDGANGIVRNQLNLSFLGAGFDADHVAIADCEIKGLDEDYWHAWGDMSSIMVVARPDRGRFSLFVSGPQVDHSYLADNPNEFLRFAAKYIQRTDLQFENVTWITDFQANVCVVDRFSSGRSFVVGDAAHVHSFFGAQGLNSAVMDAYNLGWKLSLVMAGLSPLSLLDSYNAERLPVIEEMLQYACVLHQKATDSEDAKKLQEAWFRSKGLMQLGVNYRWSAIVCTEGVEERSLPSDPYGLASGEIQAGDRAPHAPALTDLRSVSAYRLGLFSFFRCTHHTVLIFPGESNIVDNCAPIIDHCRQYSSKILRSPILILRQSEETILPSSVESTKAVVLLDTEGHAYREYAALSAGNDAPKVIIVRPDGIIGSVGWSVEGVRRYFDGILVR